MACYWLVGSMSFDDMLDRQMHDTFDPCGPYEDDHDWVEDDAFVPIVLEDQSCCVCGIYRMEVV
jgi:hypothetical protein